MKVNGGKVDVVLAGVGGQGIITMASVLADAAVNQGYNAIVAETHGLSQRGGTVIVHVRLGDVEAPLIMEGGGDLLLSLEATETLRYLKYVKKGAIVVMDMRIIRPPLPNVEVPQLPEILEELEKAEVEVYPVNAVGEAQALGNPRAANMYLIGYGLAIHGYGGMVSIDSLKQAIMSRVRNPESNIKVLLKGYNDGLNAVKR
ncbi:MAG: indolepyruvate oxidoreductase subunit beta [Desulfurococcales archaeon]|nr:indolepyruvate oxidoreductase subunit beta [Desulfurococcales archaeon]MCE4622529.1 indolepyruvate oxidoreductase subunit beta [Desulfurococcales archaeon]MCE4629087.1 indolepyruvate oxidoreductase subunit beta [Desulfurococcales archaeon]